MIMTKFEMAKEILRNSSVTNISEVRFCDRVHYHTKTWIEMSYNRVMNADELDKKSVADEIMNWLK